MRNSLGISIVLILLVAVVSATALAERGRGRGRGRGRADPGIPSSDQIVPAMEGIEWGWNHQKLMAHFTTAVKKVYSPLMAKATDAMTEDRLRREMTNRIARIKNSYVQFTGQPTGWDTSLIRDQYTHGNGESLLEVREVRGSGEDPRYTDYFFFINDQLWRRYRAFNQDQFEGIPFETAAVSFQKRFGDAKQVRNGEQLVKLEWQDRATHLEAIDNTEFYGVFCLVFTDKDVEGRLDSLRTAKQASKSKLNPLVEALDDTSSHDTNPDVVEHITGKRYNTSRPQKGSESKQQRSKQRERPRQRSDDPLDDLEI